MRVVICGGGVVGACIAYFLSLRRVEVALVERTGIACAASGKSGGFLALDWCDGTPLQGLARRSFDLHAELAREVGADWGYRRLDTYSGYGAARAAATGGGDGRWPAWLADRVTVDRQLGTTRTTGQVVPAAFTTAMMRAAEARRMRILFVAETHIHADYLSGAWQLAASAPEKPMLLLSGYGGDDWSYRYAEAAGARLVKDGETFVVGEVRVRVMHTPGHTPEHISFLITDTATSDKPIVRSKLQTGLSFDQIRIGAGEGATLAVTKLSVRAVQEPAMH